MQIPIYFRIPYHLLSETSCGMDEACPLEWDKFSIAFPETAFPQFTRKELIENLNLPPNEAAQICLMELHCPFPGSASLKQEALCAGGTSDYCFAN